jgi:hypothetical protein
MSALEDSEHILKRLNMQSLDAKGLGRWDEEYYLAGLYHPLRAMMPMETKQSPI